MGFSLGSSNSNSSSADSSGSSTTSPRPDLVESVAGLVNPVNPSTPNASHPLSNPSAEESSGSSDKVVMNARVANKIRAKKGALPANIAPSSQANASTDLVIDTSQQVSQSTGSNQPIPIMDMPRESTRAADVPEKAHDDEVAPPSTDEVPDAAPPVADAVTPDVAEGSKDPQMRKRKHKHRGKDKSSSRSSKCSQRSKGRSDERRKANAAAEQAEEEENLKNFHELTNW